MLEMIADDWWVDAPTKPRVMIHHPGGEKARSTKTHTQEEFDSAGHSVGENERNSPIAPQSS